MRWHTQVVLARFALSGAVIAATAFAGISSSWAASPSGIVVAAIPAAAANGAEGRRVLKVDGDVFMGDKVQTGPGGEAQIEFKDATKLVVGPNSLMTIDAFVFDENNTARKITVNAAKGAFRFITGNSEKQAYKINTPTATIGVRGTRFDFSVARNGEMTLALFEGVARVCDLNGVCREVRGNCAVVVAPAGGGVDPATWTTTGPNAIASRFPYVASQASLLPRFRVNTASCSDHEARRDLNPHTRDRLNFDRVTVAPTPSPQKDPHPPHDYCGRDDGEGEGQSSGRTASASASSSASSGSARSTSSEGRPGREGRGGPGGRGGRGGRGGGG